MGEGRDVRRTLALMILNAVTLGGLLSGLFVASEWAFERHRGAAPYFLALYIITAMNCLWQILRQYRQAD